MKKYQISILLSLVCICGIIIQNYRLAEMYLKSDGKTRALFGIIELVQLDMKIYLALVSITSLVFGFIAIQKKENKILSVLSICLSGVSITMLFIRLWTLMI